MIGQFIGTEERCDVFCGLAKGVSGVGIRGISMISSMPSIGTSGRRMMGIRVGPQGGRPF